MSYDKYIPKILTGQRTRLRFNGLFRLLAHLPSHIALVLSILSFKPEILPNSPKSNKEFSTDGRSAQKRFVSSANWLTLISLLQRVIPFAFSLCLILLDSNSAVSIKRQGDRGQPYLTPVEGLIQLVENPSLRIALSTSV